MLDSNYIAAKTCLLFLMVFLAACTQSIELKISPICFGGNQLQLKYSCAIAWSIQVVFVEKDGKCIPPQSWFDLTSYLKEKFPWTMIIYTFSGMLLMSHEYSSSLKITNTTGISSLCLRFLHDPLLSLGGFFSHLFELPKWSFILYLLLPERIYNPITAMGFSAMSTFQLDYTKS